MVCKKMNYVWLTCFVLSSLLNVAICKECNVSCPRVKGSMQCGFEPKQRSYHMFPSKCALATYSVCHNTQFIKTGLKYCINSLIYQSRRTYGESCPSFCPEHYRPVCGASKMRSYIYKTFNNGCFFDMLNCRGDDFSGYVEVPLDFCQRHLMKNIFKEQVVATNIHDYGDNNEY